MAEFEFSETQKSKLKESILQAETMMAKIDDPFHGLEHAQKTVEIALHIIGDVPEANSRVVEVAAWWHDVGRLYDVQNHEEVSAILATEDLKERGFNGVFIRSVYLAIKDHRWTMNPKTIEGHIVRDADKLALLDPKRWQKIIDEPSYPSENFQNSLDILKALKESVLVLEKSHVLHDKFYRELVAENIITL